MNSEEAAYLAGVIDAEAAISYESRRKRKIPTIWITSKDKSFLEGIQRIAGVGHIYDHAEMRG
jgi:hypothetical protein